MKQLLIFLFIILLAPTIFAQAITHDEEYQKKPLWIFMMDDPNVNYFEAIKAYELYWSVHQKPEGESDMNIKEKEKNKKRFSKREVREAREDAYMRMKIKKFDWWKNKMEPFVKEDGTILSPEERSKL